MFGILLTLGNIILTSLLSGIFVFFFIRIAFKQIADAISPLTTLGAKVAGTKSGFNRASKAVTEDAARGVLSSPQISGIKMIAKQFNFDIDGMIEEHGAVETLTGITQLLGMLGINPQDILTKGLGGLGENLLSQGNPPSSGGNPYK